MRRTMRPNELIFMTKGEMYFAVENEKLSVNPGDLVFVPAECLHYGWKESPSEVEFYWLHFFAEEIDIPRFTHIENSGTVLRLFRQLMDVAPLSGEDADCAATLLLHGAAREIAGMLRPHTTLAADVCQYINEHFSENINVSYLSALFGYSPDYISAKLRFATGMSAKNYITHCRLIRAKSILLCSTLSVHEVARQCGFSDPKQFFKLFKKYEGVTPSEYRRTLPEAGDVGISIKRPFKS